MKKYKDTTDMKRLKVITDVKFSNNHTKIKGYMKETGDIVKITDLKRWGGLEMNRFYQGIRPFKNNRLALIVKWTKTKQVQY